MMPIGWLVVIIAAVHIVYNAPEVITGNATIAYYSSSYHIVTNPQLLILTSVNAAGISSVLIRVMILMLLRYDYMYWCISAYVPIIDTINAVVVCICVLCLVLNLVLSDLLVRNIITVVSMHYMPIHRCQRLAFFRQPLTLESLQQVTCTHYHTIIVNHIFLKLVYTKPLPC